MLMVMVMTVFLTGFTASAAKPTFKTFKVTYSGGATSLKTGGGRYIQIKATPKSTVKTTTVISITNSKGKVVYQKTYSAAKNKAYTLNWNGKPSKGNAAKLSTSSYVPAGNYKIKVTITNTDKQKQKVTKTKTVKVAAATTTSSSGAVTSTTQWGTKIYLTDPCTDYMAEVICRKVLTKSMTTKEKMKRLYEYVAKLSTHYSTKKQVGKIDFKLNDQATQKAIASMTAYNQKLAKSGKAVISGNYTYIPGANGYTNDFFLTSDSEGNYWYNTYSNVNNFFLTGYGNCTTTASAYAVLLGHIGVEADVIWGASTGGLGHGWNIVKYGGKWYFCDCDAEHENYSRLVKKNGTLSYAFFLKGTKTFKNSYGFTFSNKVKLENGKTVTIQAADVK